MIRGNAIQCIAQARDKNIPTALMDSKLEKFFLRLVNILFLFLYLCNIVAQTRIVNVFYSMPKGLAWFDKLTTDANTEAKQTQEIPMRKLNQPLQKCYNPKI